MPLETVGQVPRVREVEAVGVIEQLVKLLEDTALETVQGTIWVTTVKSDGKTLKYKLVILSLLKHLAVPDLKD